MQNCKMIDLRLEKNKQNTTAMFAVIGTKLQILALEPKIIHQK